MPHIIRVGKHTYSGTPPSGASFWPFPGKGGVWSAVGRFVGDYSSPSFTSYGGGGVGGHDRAAYSVTFPSPFTSANIVVTATDTVGYGCSHCVVRIYRASTFVEGVYYNDSGSNINTGGGGSMQGVGVWWGTSGYLTILNTTKTIPDPYPPSPQVVRIWYANGTAKIFMNGSLIVEYSMTTNQIDTISLGFANAAGTAQTVVDVSNTYVLFS